MKLSEIFYQLSVGELSQLNLGGGGDGVIDPSHYAKVAAHIALGLNALYKRFPLKEGELTLALQPGRLTYPLKSQYAVTTRYSRESVRYILDTGSPFQDDILKIERVYDALGNELGLNDESDPMACRTPSLTTLYVPESLLPEAVSTSPDYQLRIVYRADHPALIVDPDDPESAFETEVELPFSYLEPLLYFVASRVNNPIGLVNEFNAGNNYAAKYEAACQQLEAQNIRIDQGQQFNRLEMNGWV